MEYHVDVNGPLTQQAVEEAVKHFLHSPSRTEVRSAWFSNGFEQLSPSILSSTGPNKPHDPFIWPSSSGLSGWTRLPVEFILMSDWGGRHHHFFIWRGRILSVHSDVWHPRWTLMPARRWYSSVSFPRVGAGVVYESPGNRPISQWTQEQKIMEAMKRAPGRVPGHLKTYLAELLTPANIIITVGLTIALMASGVGEVIGLGLLVVGAVTGGLDLVLVVLKMLYQFYKKASDATTERELDEAAELFAQAVMRGGTDIIDMVIGRRAVSKLAGRGIKSVGEFFWYLDREMTFLRGRNAGGGKPLPGTAPQETKPTPKKESSPPPKPPRPSNADLLRAGDAPDQGGYTAAGRAAQKHGSRPDSVFPPTKGNPEAVNAQGQRTLEAIVNDPAAIRSPPRHHARFGDIIDVKLPDGRGARFSADGKKFITFIEPNSK